MGGGISNSSKRYIETDILSFDSSHPFNSLRKEIAFDSSRIEFEPTFLKIFYSTGSDLTQMPKRQGLRVSSQGIKPLYL